MMELGFLDLINSNRWQVIQDYFSQVINAGVRVVDCNGEPLTSLSKPCRYCYELISSSPQALSECNQCSLLSPVPQIKDDLFFKKQNFLDQEGNIYYDQCSFFVNRIYIPIKLLEGNICGYIIIGPVVLGKRKAYTDYFNLSKNLELDINEVIDYIETIRVFSFNSIESIVKLFQEVVNCMVRSGYERIKNRTKNAVFLTEDQNKTNFYRGKMIQALFETATEGVNAERASVMLFDADSETLSIKVAKGIPDKISRNVKIRKGEGLAGWVAAENQILFIDHNFKNPRLISRLRQPQLKASLMVPIRSAKKVLGVLSLSTQAENNKFTSENINSIIQLTKMVDSALVGLSADNRIQDLQDEES
ncbi:MAG: PocR ligand-binding domain-containing protein [Candidatus Omnitrophota bacterium]